MEGPKRITLAELDLPNAMPLPKRKDWRIGMIGFGEFAQRAHLPDYAQAGWETVAVAVSNPAAQAAARERFGIKRVYSDYRELINDDAVEVVDVVTQPTFREKAVLAAADAGKHIIVEKPFGRSTQECERMVEAADRAGITLAVHQNYRWMKGNFVAHHLVKDGWIGAPFFLGIDVFGRQDELSKHHFYATCDDYLTLHWNTHLADLLGYWSGSNAGSVAAHTAAMTGQNFRSDNLFISVHDFGPGVTGHILHSELLRSSLGGNRCRIDGNRGSVVFDFEGQNILLESDLLGEGVRWVDTSSMEWMEALCGSMGDFLVAIEEGREPMVSGRRNLATMRTVMAEIQSSKSGGGWVDTVHEKEVATGAL